MNLFTFMAEGAVAARLWPSSAYRTPPERDHRAYRNLLRQVSSRGAAHLDDLDLNSLLAKALTPATSRCYCTLADGRGATRCRTPSTPRMIEDAGPLFEVGEKMQLTYNVRNTYRANRHQASRR